MALHSFSGLLRHVLPKVRIIPSCSMYDNPYVKRFKEKAGQVSPDFHKQSTGLTGLFVKEHPHHDLKVAYTRTLKLLQKMPETYVYRQSTEAIVKKRLEMVEKEPDILKLEEKIGMGQLEEVIQQANYELEAARELLINKAWEPLIEPAPESQWRWPIH